MASHEQARNVNAQLQAYVEELQQENDQLSKKERKSTNNDNIPRLEVEKMQVEFTEEIQKYEEELQKYRMAFDQYEEQT